MPKIWQRLEALNRVEKAIDDLHTTLYKNGLSSKVNTLWEWRRDINKVLVILITTLIIGLGAFIWRSVIATGNIEEKLKSIEHRLQSPFPPPQ